MFIFVALESCVIVCHDRLVFFFFSSRRRHTRCSRDWSSDVCSSDLFFLPIDRFNECFEELNNHADWSFYGGDFPSNRELLEARNRVLARHPRTQFIERKSGG